MTQVNQRSNQKIRQRTLRRRQEKSKKANRYIAAIIIGIVVITLFLARPASTPNVTSGIEAQSEDFVYGEPINAIHEMTGSNLSSIPFLPEGEPQPQIAVSELFFDFGSIGSTEIVQHDFVITNMGEAPLTLSRAYTTCGCTTAHFTASKIPPGKAVLVTLTLDAGYHDVRGQTVKRGLIIENNDMENPEFTIWTEASVRTTP